MMCVPFSFYAAIIDGSAKIWWSDKTDSHSEIAKEHNIRDHRGSVYAGEFHPDGMNPSPDTTTWILEWDSESTNASRESPSQEDADAIRSEVEKIARRFVVVDGDQVVTTRGWAFGKSKQTVYGGIGYARNFATQIVIGGICGAYDSATQIVNGGHGFATNSATQIVNGGSGYASESATQTVYGGVGWAKDSATQTVNGGEGRRF